MVVANNAWPVAHETFYDRFAVSVFKTRGVEDGKPYFSQYVRPDSECWLIIDDDSEHFPVVETSAAVAEMLLGELPYVEFYLVGKDFDWLLAENHHGAIWLL